MHLSQIRLSQFRSYEQLDLTLAPGTIIMVGQNGQGKTNFVEAIGFLANLRSHRVAKNEALIKHSYKQGIIQARISDSGRAATVEVAINSDRQNNARLNGKQVNSTRDLLGITRVVFFSPEDLALAKGEPATRRKFADELVVQLRPSMARELSAFERTARQRGALLKAIRQRGSTADARAQLGLWNERFAAAAVPVVKARLELLDLLKAPASEFYRRVSSSADDFVIAYQRRGLAAQVGKVDPVKLASELLDQMAQEGDNEMARGVNLTGPNYDDLALTLNGMEVKSYGSHGEMWSVALALRLAAFELLRGNVEIPAESDFWLPTEVRSSDPILILDDVFPNSTPADGRS